MESNYIDFSLHKNSSDMKICRKIKVSYIFIVAKKRTVTVYFW